LKILHLISSSGFFGAERVLLNLAGDPEVSAYVGALHNSHNPHLEVIDEAKKLGLKTIVFGCAGKFDFRTIFAIRQFIKTNKIDILHTHNYKSDIFGFLVVKLIPVRWVATNHNWLGSNSRLKLYEQLDALILRHAYAVVAVSKKVEEDVVHKDVKWERVNVIENGVDLARFRRAAVSNEFRKSLGVSEADRVVAIVGRLSPEKGHEILLKAAAQISQRMKDVKFLIVGDGPLMASLKAEAAKLNLSNNVIFAGIRQDMPSIYSLSDILVNASTIEGLPMTILEAMAAQVPVVATKVGGIPDLIEDNKTGVLVDSGNAEGLAEKIQLLLDDKPKREAIAQAAYQLVVSRYSVERMAAEYRKLYAGI